MPVDMRALTTDLAAESAELYEVLSVLAEPDWGRDTAAAGWTVRDQVTHLAYFDETATLSATDPDRFRVTVTFDEQQDGKTVLTLRQLHPSAERRRFVIGFGAVEYGLQTLDGLAAWLDR